MKNLLHTNLTCYYYTTLNDNEGIFGYFNKAVLHEKNKQESYTHEYQMPQ